MNYLGIEKTSLNRTIKELNQDEGTIDMIGGFLESIEKKSWMLDAWMSKRTEPVA